MHKGLLGLLGGLGLVFATAGAASAAPRPIANVPQAHSNVVQADYYWHRHHWRHRRWEHRRWRYWD
jgi:hypothetical protein